MELAGKIALVTGAARRVGRAIALALAEAGADVVLHYLRSGAQAVGTADEIRAMGRRAELLRADLARPEDIAAMFKRLARLFGRLDVLVNSAGVYHRTPIETLTPRQWDMELAINARAPALCIRHAIPLMGGGGVIINLTDSGAERGFPGYSAYCASKGALVALTRSTARALAGRNIRVNAVAPGIAEWQDKTPEAEKQKVLEQIPMRREGTPEDIAGTVVFLVRQDYITGQVLRVDGGWRTA